MSHERYRQLVEAHKDVAYRAAFRLVQNHGEALDILQEACLELFRNLDTMSDEWVPAWLVRVASNRALDRLRRRRIEPQLSDQPDSWLEKPETPIDSLVRGERQQQALGALAELSPRQREVVTLRVCQTLSFVTIARQLGLSEGAVKVHFRRGMTTLRERLGALREEGP